MTLTSWLVVATAAYAVHVLEELTLDWRTWARSVLKLQVEWSAFYVANAVVIVLGCAAAALAAAKPAVALAFPALMIINATLFHVGQMFRTRGRFSPGTFTAILLFLPIGAACFHRAHVDGTLGLATTVVAFSLGALAMATPIAFLKLAQKPYFRQDGAAVTRSTRRSQVAQAVSQS